MCPAPHHYNRSFEHIYPGSIVWVFGRLILPWKNNTIVQHQEIGIFKGIVLETGFNGYSEVTVGFQYLLESLHNFQNQFAPSHMNIFPLNVDRDRLASILGAGSKEQLLNMINNPRDRTQDFREWCYLYNCWVRPPSWAVASPLENVAKVIGRFIGMPNPYSGGNVMNASLHAMNPAEVLPLDTVDWIKSLPVDQQEKINGFYDKLWNEHTKL